MSCFLVDKKFKVHLRAVYSSYFFFVHTDIPCIFLCADTRFYANTSDGDLFFGELNGFLIYYCKDLPGGWGFTLLALQRYK